MHFNCLFKQSILTFILSTSVQKKKKELKARLLLGDMRFRPTHYTVQLHTIETIPTRLNKRNYRNSLELVFTVFIAHYRCTSVGLVGGRDMAATTTAILSSSVFHIFYVSPRSNNMVTLWIEPSRKRSDGYIVHIKKNHCYFYEY